MDQSIMNMVLWFAVFFVIIYFIIIRPNKKQQNERRMMLDSLRVKDEVITIGGIHGTITKVKEDTIILRIANNVEIELLKTGIQSIENRDYKEDLSGKKKKGRTKTKDDKAKTEEDNCPDDTDNAQTEVKETTE